MTLQYLECHIEQCKNLALDMMNAPDVVKARLFFSLLAKGIDLDSALKKMSNFGITFALPDDFDLATAANSYGEIIQNFGPRMRDYTTAFDVEVVKSWEYFSETMVKHIPLDEEYEFRSLAILFWICTLGNTYYYVSSGESVKQTPYEYFLSTADINVQKRVFNCTEIVFVELWDNKLLENPARIAGNMGTERGIQMQFWTKEQYLKFAEAAMDCPLAYYCFEVLYWGGIREGELLALTPADFDFESQQMSISKTYHMLNGKEYITEPKTPKSIRKVHMPDFLVEEIKDFMEMQYGLKSTDRLFPTGKSFLYRMMEKCSKEAGVPKIRIHDLRHSHVSLLIDMGFSAVAIAERMGHESIDITYRYAHLFPSVQTEMASKLNGMREGGDGNVGEE